MKKYIALSAVSLAALALLFVVQTLFLLARNALVFVYEGIGALELYASLCLVYFAIRLVLEVRGRNFRPLFALVFCGSGAYACAVLLNADFNVLSVATSLACALLLFAGVACLAYAAVCYGKREKRFLRADKSLFSAREREVVRLILQGKTAQETADALFISLATVKTHVQHIYEKAQVRNRVELALYVKNHLFSR